MVAAAIPGLLPFLAPVSTRPAVNRRRFLQQLTCSTAAAVTLTQAGGTSAYWRGPEVLVTPLSGDVIRGIVAEMTPEKLTLAGKIPRQFPWSQLIGLEWLGQPAASVLDSPVLVFPNRDLLALQVRQVTDTAITARWSHFPAWPEVEVPLEVVRGAVLRPVSDAGERRQQLVRVEDHTAHKDVLWLTNEDRLQGELDAPDQGHWKLVADAGPVTLPPERIRAVAFNPQLASFPDEPESTVVLLLVDGSRLTGQIQGWLPQGTLQFQSLWGAQLLIPQDQLAGLRLRHPGCTWLSRLEPSAYASTPYLTREWTWRRDRNVLGGELACPGRQFLHGLGVHGQTRLTFPLDGQYATFRAAVGLDLRAVAPASVECAVLVDDREVFRSPVLRRGREAVPIGPLPVANAQSLTLLTSMADYGDLQDHVNWCEPVFTRAQA